MAVGSPSVAALAGRLSVLLSTFAACNRTGELWAQFGKYCVDCHNRDDLTANIAFDKMSPDSRRARARDVRGRRSASCAATRCRRRARPQPPPETRDVARDWLETTLDAAAAQAPNPGRVALHRLNRTEYANAIERSVRARGRRRGVAAEGRRERRVRQRRERAQGVAVVPRAVHRGGARRQRDGGRRSGRARSTAACTTRSPARTRTSTSTGMPLGTRGGMLRRALFPGRRRVRVRYRRARSRALRRGPRVSPQADPHDRRRQGVRERDRRRPRT